MSKAENLKGENWGHSLGHGPLPFAREATAPAQLVDLCLSRVTKTPLLGLRVVSQAPQARPTFRPCLLDSLMHSQNSHFIHPLSSLCPGPRHLSSARGYDSGWAEVGGVVCPPQCAYIFTFLTALNTNRLLFPLQSHFNYCPVCLLPIASIIGLVYTCPLSSPPSPPWASTPNAPLKLL